MTSRIVRTRTKDTVDVTGEILQEALAVSRFLVRVAKENDFWVSATKAELLLHESFIFIGDDPDFHDAARAYASAGLVGRVEHLRSAKNQLEFLRTMGDPDSVIAMLDAHDPGWSRRTSSS